MKRKGISPLIAVIMLIAFVLVVSGIFYSWLSQFTLSQRQEFQFCAHARISLLNAYYNPGTGNVNLLVFNGGDIPLTGFTILVSSKEATPPQVNRNYIETEIKENDIGVLLVSYNDQIDSITVQSIECQNAQDLIRLFDVEGL